MSDSLSISQRETAYRRNFKVFLFDWVIFAAAMGLISPGSVIPDFIRRLTDSEILIGLSGSLFDIGWMMPQLFMARYLVRVSHKKWWFIGPNIPVRFAILIFSGVIVTVGKGHPGAILFAFLICYGTAAVGDGLVGVPWVDLLGSSLDDKRRARLFGLGTAIVGVITLGISPLVGLILSDDGPTFPNNYALLFGVAGLFFALSIPIGLLIHELPGGQAVENAPTFREFIPELGRVLRHDLPFRAMVITRLLSSLFTTMAGPFYIGFATTQLDVASGTAVSIYIAMNTTGSVTGALIYSWMGIRHNLLFIRSSLLIATLLPASALLASEVGPLPLYIGYFISGLALSNLFTSYLNWIIQHATPTQRPVYTGLFNTVAAVGLLIGPLIGGLIVQEISFEAVFAAALVLILGAFFVVTRFIPAEHPSSNG